MIDSGDIVPQDKPLVTAIDHCSLIVADTAKALAFYTGILGLKVDESRPDLGYPGAWLQITGSQIHLLEVPNPDPLENRPAHGGRDRHLALQVTDLQAVIQRLQQAGIAYSKSKSGRAALFCRDFDENAIELVEK
jgi:glyoxylase I family protein